jgi:hypothetical protein
MARLKGSKNKPKPAIITWSAEQRINILANIILDIVIEEQEQERGRGEYAAPTGR